MTHGCVIATYNVMLLLPPRFKIKKKKLKKKIKKKMRNKRKRKGK